MQLGCLEAPLRSGRGAQRSRCRRRHSAVGHAGQASRSGVFGIWPRSHPKRELVLRAASTHTEASTAEHVLALHNAVEAAASRATSGASAGRGRGRGRIVGMRRELLGARAAASPTTRGRRRFQPPPRHLVQSWLPRSETGRLGFAPLRSSKRSSSTRRCTRSATGTIFGALQGDRRCFAFFHPQLPQTPLIFVKVELVSAIPRSIAHLISGRPAQPDGDAMWPPSIHPQLQAGTQGCLAWRHPDQAGSQKGCATKRLYLP